MKKWYLLIPAVLFCFIAAGFPAAASDTMVVIQEAEPVGLDLMQSSIQTTMSVCYNIHDTLFHPQEDATVLPALAEKWEKVDDLTWKIALRKDAVFHNGEPVNAAAVKFSFDRANDEALKNPHRGKLSAFTELNVVDDYTVTVKTAEPYAPGLYMLATTCRSYRPSTSRKLATPNTTPTRSVAGPTASKSGCAEKRSCWKLSTSTTAPSRPTKMLSSRLRRRRLPASRPC